MLSALRRNTAFLPRLSALVAFVVLFLATIGELSHFRAHQKLLTVAGLAHIQADSVAESTSNAIIAPSEPDCGMCAWHGLASTPAVVFAALAVVLLPFLRIILEESGFLYVRLIAELRSSRGPPVLA